MTHTSNNFFGIPNADQLYCCVSRYSPHHSALKIRVFNANDDTYCWLYFTVPVFFNCPAIWKSASFRKASIDELIAFISDSFPYYNGLKAYRLYTAAVDTEMPQKKTVRILAQNATMQIQE